MIEHTTSRLTPETTFYHYDVHGLPGEFESHNNRLMLRSAYAGVLTAEPAGVEPLEQVEYNYDVGGNPMGTVLKCGKIVR